MKQGRERIFRTVLVVAVPLVLLATVELGVRGLQHFGGLPRYRGSSLTVGDDSTNLYNARLVRSADPELGFEFAGDDPLLNSHRTRGPEFSTSKPAGTFRIVVVGDSVAFGLGVPTEDTFCARLQKLLNEHSNGTRYEVLNFGVNGYGTSEELRLFRARIDGALAPDLVVIAYVLNDPFPPKLMVSTVADRMRAIARIDAVSRYSQLAAWALLQRETVASWLNPYGGYEAIYSDREAWEREEVALRGFAEISLQRKLPVAVVVFPLLADYARYGLAKYHTQVHDSLEVIGIPSLDLSEVFQQEPLENIRIRASDDTHPNALGHRLAAESIYAWLPAVDPALRGSR